MSKNEKKTRQITTIVMATLSLITVAAVSVTVWALFLREPDIVLTPDYAPQKKEENAIRIPEEDDDNPAETMQAVEGGGAVSLTYGTNVSIILSNETAALYLANPSRSAQDMVVQVVIQDTILVQSGRLIPGNQVTTLKLLKGAAEKLSPGGYEGKIVVLYYDRENGEKAIVNTEIPVTISVVE